MVCWNDSEYSVKLAFKSGLRIKWDDLGRKLGEVYLLTVLLPKPCVVLPFANGIFLESVKDVRGVFRRVGYFLVHQDDRERAWNELTAEPNPYVYEAHDNGTCLISII
jgi:hypothetical protein